MKKGKERFAQEIFETITLENYTELKKAKAKGVPAYLEFIKKLNKKETK